MQIWSGQQKLYLIFDETIPLMPGSH